MIRKFLIVSASMILTTCCYCQNNFDDPVTISLPSPDNSFLGSKDEVSGNLFTGGIQTNVPIYGLASKELKIPIGLEYISKNGVKVQDVSGSAGLGWQLNTGGSITRIVRGLPDEQPHGYIGTNGSGATVNAASGLNPSYSLISQIGMGQIDGEPDIFYISTPFFNIQFIFDQNGHPVFHGNKGFVISHQMFNNPNYTATSWVVTDDKGNRYFFGSSSASIESQTDSLYSQSKNYISTWYLDKIISYNSKDIVTFTYAPGPDYSVKHFLWSQTNFTTSPTCSIATPFNVSKFQTTTYNSPKYLQTINTQLGEADFSYASDRRDLTTALRLSSISIKALNPSTNSNNSVLQSYNFNYSYFGTPSSDINQLRLRLDNITVSGNTASTSNPLLFYSFGYNTNSNLPPRNSVQFDYWGYYNNNSASTPIVPSASRTPDPSRAAANILTSIANIEGGVTTLQYQLNDFYSGTSNVTGGGVRIAQISKTLPTGENNYKQFIYTDANGNSTGQINNPYYQNLNSNINVLIYAGSNSCGISGTNTSSESIFNAYQLDGYSVGYSSVKTMDQNGGYETDLFTNFSDFPDVFNSNNTSGVTYSYANSRQLSCATSISYKRGLLLDRKIFASVSGTVKQVSETSNTYTTIGSPLNNSFSIRSTLFTLIAGGSINAWLYGTYQYINEDYLLNSTTVYENDQLTPANSIATSTTYKYTSNSNYKTVFLQQVNSSDSKSQTISKTFYHANDAGIPMVTSPEQTALTALLNANYTNVLVHEIDVRNGITTRIHNSYQVGTGNNNNGFPNTYLVGTTRYNGNTQVKQQLFNYNFLTSNLASWNSYSSYMPSSNAGKPVSLFYDYNASYPTAKIENASSGSTSSNEFYFEGFEQSGWGTNVTTGGAHTGNAFFSSSSFSPAFTKPNSRNYMIQYWHLSGGVWNFNETTYANGMILSGPLDDIRIFPSDGLMTTYTYNPLIGITSQTDPSGKSLIYKYDGLNRLLTILDQDQNVLQQYDYQYRLAAKQGYSILGITGTPGFSSAGPTYGQGTIYGPVGYIVTVTMYANGTPGYNYGLIVSINGVTINGPTQVTNGTASYTFVMPSSGMVGWTASFVPTGGSGGGDFSVK